MINHEHKCIFIHINKCGGCSVDQFFTGSFQGHLKALEYKKSYPNDFNNYFKFTFVRNPWDRVVSAYHHFSSETSFKEYVVGGKKLVPIFRFFDEYIDDVHFTQILALIGFQMKMAN